MRADAVISGLTGVALLLLAPRVAEWSGTTPAVEYATGAFFVVFGITVLALAARPAVRTSGVVLAVGNALFSVLTVVVVLAVVAAGPRGSAVGSGGHRALSLFVQCDVCVCVCARARMRSTKVRT